MHVQSTSMHSPQFGGMSDSAIRKLRSRIGTIGTIGMIVFALGSNKYLGDTYTQATGKEPKGLVLDTHERYIAIQAHHDKFEKKNDN